jgi:hypothetical protein
LSSDEIATVKTWLVANAERLERAMSYPSGVVTMV